VVGKRDDKLISTEDAKAIMSFKRKVLPSREPPHEALAHVRSELSGDERTPGRTFPYRKTILFTRQNGVWGIRALHNTRLLGVE
jgi:hypothetical protein